MRQLLSELRILLKAEMPHDEPLAARLFPDAYEDEENSRAYRDLVGDELHSAKFAASERVADLLTSQRIVLDGDDLDAWLTTLTDLRLALGTRLQVTEERMAGELDPDDPDAASLAVLHWLGLLQERILEAATTGRAYGDVE